MKNKIKIKNLEELRGLYVIITFCIGSYIFKKEFRILVLKWFYDNVFYNSKEPYNLRRATIRFSKKVKHGKCYCCKKQGYATQYHHIIPIRNGGIDSKFNKVKICKNCHSEIHIWLKKIKKYENK